MGKLQPEAVQGSLPSPTPLTECSKICMYAASSSPGRPAHFFLNLSFNRTQTAFFCTNCIPCLGSAEPNPSPAVYAYGGGADEANESPVGWGSRKGFE